MSLLLNRVVILLPHQNLLGK
ncbi:hypothetical protein PP427_gp190 [Salmonella phage KM16]|nr:hypothetical protein PP427_gp190 [Salmonella phage KM16]